MYKSLTPERKTVVKEVLFGKQKQASVINDGVVAIVGKSMEEMVPGCTNDTGSFVDAVRNVLQKAVDGENVKPVLVMLLGGEQSYINLQEAGPKIVYCESAGPETPKFYFAIQMLGEDAVVQTEEPVGIMDSMFGVAEPVPESPKKFEDMSYAAQRDYLVEKIVPLVPAAVKQELSNPVEQALVGSQWYFKNN